MPLSSLTGTRIRQRRGLVGLRQAELARAAGISASYLNLIEHNRRKVAGPVLARIAAALGVTEGALTGGAEGGLLDDLREAAGQVAPGAGSGAASGPAPEIDRLEDFAGRYPGWAALLAAQHRRIAQLDRTVEALSDRMSHDPYLSAALHEVLSVAASVRSTAAILADTPDIDRDWRGRFEANLVTDSARLAQGAEALVAYLDTDVDPTMAVASPQEEVETWLAARGYHLPELEADQPWVDAAALIAAAPELSSRAAQSLAADWIARARADARALPATAVLAALAEDGPDPWRLAARFGVDPGAVFRRLATLPDAAGPEGVGPEGVGPEGVGPIGLVICDGSGTLVFRRPLAGFGLPRFGAACPLWPLYVALSRPSVPLRIVAEMPAPAARRFLTYAYCQPEYAGGYDAAPVLRAYMLLLPAPPLLAGVAVQAVGTSCRVCPRGPCVARREPAIVAEGG